MFWICKKVYSHFDRIYHIQPIISSRTDLFLTTLMTAAIHIAPCMNGVIQAILIPSMDNAVPKKYLKIKADMKKKRYKGRSVPKNVIPAITYLFSFFSRISFSLFFRSSVSNFFRSFRSSSSFMSRQFKGNR